MKSEAERSVPGGNRLLIFRPRWGTKWALDGVKKSLKSIVKKKGFGNMRAQERGPKTNAHSYHMHLEIYIKIMSFLQKM